MYKKTNHFVIKNCSNGQIRERQTFKMLDNKRLKCWTLVQLKYAISLNGHSVFLRYQMFEIFTAREFTRLIDRMVNDYTTMLLFNIYDRFAIIVICNVIWFSYIGFVI